jgi:hypothetical protein
LLGRGYKRDAPGWASGRADEQKIQWQLFLVRFSYVEWGFGRGAPLLPFCLFLRPFPGANWLVLTLPPPCQNCFAAGLLRVCPRFLLSSARCATWPPCSVDRRPWSPRCVDGHLIFRLGLGSFPFAPPTLCLSLALLPLRQPATKVCKPASDSAATSSKRARGAGGGGEAVVWPPEARSSPPKPSHAPRPPSGTSPQQSHCHCCIGVRQDKDFEKR